MAPEIPSRISLFAISGVLRYDAVLANGTPAEAECCRTGKRVYSSFVFGSRKNKEEHRYYLLPGMGRSNRRRHAQFLRWAIGVGLVISALFTLLLYYLNRPSI